MKPVIPDTAEQIQGLAQTVSAVVFSDHHVVTAAGSHKNYGRHIWSNTLQQNAVT